MSFAHTQDSGSSPTGTGTGTSPPSHAVVGDDHAAPDTTVTSHFSAPSRVDSLDDDDEILADSHVLGYHSADTSMDFDDHVLRSCSVIAYTASTPLTLGRSLPGLHTELACSTKAQASLPPLSLSHFTLAAAQSTDAASTASTSGVSSPRQPPLQPGAGIYTSPLTVNVSRSIDATQGVIREALRSLQMPFHEDAAKFKVRATLCCNSDASALLCARMYVCNH